MKEPQLQQLLQCLNPLSAGRSFQTLNEKGDQGFYGSYSLISREVFSDDVVVFGQYGDSVLIPYQQGGLFRLVRLVNEDNYQCLNPLSAGRSFQTLVEKCCLGRGYVLIPYQQGGLFRRSRSNHNQPQYSLNPLSAGRSFQTYSVTQFARSQRS